MIASWVVGSGGLLGSALVERLGSEGLSVFEPGERFHWNDPCRRAEQLAEAVAGFAAYAAAAGRWEIYWAAGVGTMRSSAAELSGETAALRELLRQVGSSDRLCRMSGTIGLASSAGAIYAGCDDWTITEHSALTPTTAYAREKLVQEAALAEFAAASTSVRAFALRLSTLYGPSQARAKAQGLLSHIARSVVSGQPIQIYVPLDTVRDYIAAADAAADVIRAVRAAPQTAPFTVRIVAAERPTTISEIVSVFRRVARRPLRIVTGSTAQSALYARRVQFRSVVAPRLVPTRKVSLLVGVAQVLDAERRRCARGDPGAGRESA